MEGWNGMGTPTCTNGTRARTSRSDTWISQTSLSFCASGSWPGYSTCHVRGRAGASPPVPFSTATSRCRNSAGSDNLQHHTEIRVEQPTISTAMGDWDIPYLELSGMAGMSPSRWHVTTAVECLGPRECSRCTLQVLGIVGRAETTCRPFLALILWGTWCHTVSDGVTQ